MDSLDIGKMISDSQHGHYSQATIRAVVHANAGQRVYIRNFHGGDNDYHAGLDEPYTTFTGTLIHAEWVVTS
jgi:hypothetical protein